MPTPVVIPNTPTGGDSDPKGNGTGNNNPPVITNQPVYTPPPRPGFYMDDTGHWQPIPPPPKDGGVSWGNGNEGWGDGIPRDQNGNPIDTNGNPIGQTPVPAPVPEGPFVSGNNYSLVKGYATNSLTLVVNALATMTLTPAQRTALNARKDGLTALLALLEKIETNTKGVWLDVEVDNAQVASAFTSRDNTTGWIKITISPAPVFPTNPNPTDEQLDDYENAMQAYTALLAHELKHVDQFIDGKLSFNRTSGQAGVLRDIQDEIESYNLQFLIMGNPVPTTDVYIRALQLNGIPVYGINVPDGPLQVGSPNIILTNDIYIQP